jgi:hypothetical protein
MPFLDQKPKLLTALSRVPIPSANQQAVNQFVELLDEQLSDVFSTGGTAPTFYIYLGQPADALARFVIISGATVSFSIQLKSPSTGAWVNKVTYTQT